MSKSSKFVGLVALCALGAGAYYWNENREPEAISPDPDTTITGGAVDATEESTEAPSSDLGTVAPPVTIENDPLGDGTFDQLLDDWTPVEAPTIPDRSSEVRAEWVTNSRIQQNLPDGTYWGFLHSIFDEEERGINFDVIQYDGEFIRSSDGDQLYPAYLEDLLYTSVVTGDAEPGDTRNAYVAPTTLWAIANGDTVATDIEVRGWYLLTIIDGKVMAAEGAVAPWSVSTP